MKDTVTQRLRALVDATQRRPSWKSPGQQPLKPPSTTFTAEARLQELERIATRILPKLLEKIEPGAPFLPLAQVFDADVGFHPETWPMRASDLLRSQDYQYLRGPALDFVQACVDAGLENSFQGIHERDGTAQITYTLVCVRVPLASKPQQK